ncbi:MAG: MATE family efflux transporter [Lachnospiraceae bacterium]|nr:MATE family efflux transporter [Lachnospiraceae bacterium]
MSVFAELKNKAFYAKTVHIMVPVLVQQIISVGIGFFDNVMIGKFGESQIAAAALSNNFFTIFYFITMGLGSGAIVLSSQFWGAGEREKLKNVAAIAMRITLVIGVLFTLVAVIAPGGVLRIFTNIDDVITVGRGYLRIIGITFFMMGLTSSSTYLLRSTGQVRIPLISSIIAFFLNIFFNWIFIFGKFGAPRLEVVGAGVGTLIARAFECAFIFGFFVLRDKNIGFRLKHFFLKDRELTKTYMRYSLPVLISDTLLGIGISLQSVIIGHLNAAFVAANSITMTINHVVTVLNTAMGAASGVVIGNTVGTGDKDKAFREGTAFIVLAVAIGAAVSVLYLFTSSYYMRIYSISAETLMTAKEIFKALILMSPFQTMAFVTSKGILRGGGDTRFMMVGDIILLWALSLPLGALAGFVWHLPPFWIYFFLTLEYGAKGILCLIRFITKRWIKVIKVTSEA